MILVCTVVNCTDLLIYMTRHGQGSVLSPQPSSGRWEGGGLQCALLAGDSHRQAGGQLYTSNWLHSDIVGEGAGGRAIEKYYWCRAHPGATMFCVSNIFINPDLRLKSCFVVIILS